MAENTNSWIEVPSFNNLSREQKEVYGASLDSNILINGAAGSGKTILAILRAKQLASKGKRILFITFTKILHQFTELAASQYNLDNVDIVYTSQMVYNVFGRHVKSLSELTENMIDRLIENYTGVYDHIIVDEGQDFEIKIYNNLFQKLGNVHTVCADKKQSIYSESDYNSKDVKAIYSPMIENVLDFTYRNPMNVLATSSGFWINKFRNSPAELKGGKIKTYNESKGEVRLVQTNNEVDSIATIIKNRAKNTVGVLLPNNAAVKFFYDALTDRDLGEIEHKFSIGGDWDNTVDFFNTNPKVLTYHSAKGIQFDTVILPLLNNTYDDRIKFTNQTEEVRAFYVAMTRTKKTLYFIKPGEHICPYYDFIPMDFLKIVQRPEDEVPKLTDIYDFGDKNEDLPF